NDHVLVPAPGDMSIILPYIALGYKATLLGTVYPTAERGGTPVYEAYSTKYGHYYTRYQSEYLALDKNVWTKRGILFYTP
ncbi:MAG TPA: hypothetical protein VN132_07090, partial [Bdellovibrio sp.]|nr:hypothetical protein [Bdellovibrio sp.]